MHAAPSAHRRARETLVCGTGYTGEDGVELLLAPDDAPARLGRAACDAAPCPPGSARATRCAWRSASTSTATTSPRSAARSRPAWAGAARRTRASSAPRPSRAVREAGPAEQLVAVRHQGPGIARQGNPVVGGGEVTSGTLSPCLERGIGMAYVPAERRRRGHRASRSTSAASTRRATVAQARSPCTSATATSGAAAMADESYPEDLLYHPEHDWAQDRGRRRHVRHHLVRPGPARRGRVLRPAGGRARPSAKDEPYAEVESVKAVSDVDRAAVRRDHRGQRRRSRDEPEQINEDPYGEGWLVKVRLSTESERDRPAAGRRRPTAPLCSDLRPPLGALR